MTGLNADTDHILEMACLITDSQLNVVAEVCLPLAREWIPLQGNCNKNVLASLDSSGLFGEQILYFLV